MATVLFCIISYIDLGKRFYALEILFECYLFFMKEILMTYLIVYVIVLSHWLYHWEVLCFKFIVEESGICMVAEPTRLAVVVVHSYVRCLGVMRSKITSPTYVWTENSSPWTF